MPKQPAPPPPERIGEVNKLHRREDEAVGPSQYVIQDSSEEEISTLQEPHPGTNDNNARMSLQLNGFPTTLLIDSGASVNVSLYMSIRRSNNKNLSYYLHQHVSFHVVAANHSRPSGNVTSPWTHLAKDPW